MKLLPLLFLLLLPVVAGAEVIEVISGHGKCAKTTNTNEWVCKQANGLWEDATTALYITVKEGPDCYAKMQEAMRVMNAYIQGRDGFMIYRHSNGSTGLERKPNWEPDRQTKQQWDETMKACVEGK